MTTDRDGFNEKDGGRMISEYRRRAFDRRNQLRWPIRLRLLLILPGSWRWNAWVRDWTARLGRFKSYEDETTEKSELGVARDD